MANENYGFQIPMCQDYIALQMNRTFTFKNNNLFYSFLPNAYRDYYRQVVKSSLEWLDGYVWGFHSAVNGIFSMQLCPALIKGLATSIKGGKLIFERVGSGEDVDLALNFLNYEWKNNCLDDAVLQGITVSMAGACPCLKLNVANNNLWVEAVRQDCFYFDSDSRDKVLEARFFIKNFIYEIAKENEERQVRNYFLVEHRFFKECDEEKIIKRVNDTIIYKKGANIPMVEYYVCAYFGTANSNLMPNVNDTTYECVDYKQLPQKIKDQIKDNYGAIQIGKPQPLPFSDYLGVELLKYGGKDMTTNTANFGNSLISQLSQYFMFYDYAWSLRARDLYLGKGTVLLPKQFSLNQDGGFGATEDSGINLALKTPFNGVLDDAMYQNYDSNDPNGGQPKSIQFEYRVEEITKLTDDIIKKCATMIGVSPKMFASYLAQGQAQKTATEVDAEDDISMAYIYQQREHFIAPITRLIERVLLYYNKSTKIKVRFGTPSLENKDKKQKRILEQLQVGIIDLEEAIRQLYPDKDEDAIKCMVIKAREQQQDNDRRKAVFVSTSGQYGI